MKSIRPKEKLHSVKSKMTVLHTQHRYIFSTDNMSKNPF